MKHAFIRLIHSATTEIKRDEKNNFTVARYGLVNINAIMSERVIAHLRSVCLHRLSLFQSDSQERINKGY